MKHLDYICNPILQNKLNTNFIKFTYEFSNNYYKNITQTETLLKEIAMEEKELTLIIPNVNILN